MKPVLALTLIAVLFAAPLIAEEGKSDPLVAKTHKLSVKAAGPPVPAFRYELVPSFRNQTHGNAALLYHRAMLTLVESRPPQAEAFEAEDQIRAALELPTKDFPREEVRLFLKRYANVFKEIESAVRCDQCDWGTDALFAAEGATFRIPEAQQLRHVAFLLSVRCRLHAADGKFDLAIRDVQSSLAMARHASRGPGMINYLVGTAIAHIALEGLERVLQMPDCPNLYWSLTAMPRPFADFGRAIEGELSGMEATLAFPKKIDDGPIAAEQALAAIDQFREVILGLSDRATPQSIAFRLGAATFVAFKHPSARATLLAAGKTAASLDAMPSAQVVLLDSLVRFRDLRDEHFVWANAPYVEAVSGFKRAEEKFRAMRIDRTDLPLYMLSSLIPAVQRLYESQTRLERRIAALRTVELVRWHAAKNGGVLPNRLGDISAAVVPLDLVTGQPFAYTVDGSSFSITVATPPGDKPSQMNNLKYQITLVK